MDVRAETVTLTSPSRRFRRREGDDVCVGESSPSIIVCFVLECPFQSLWTRHLLLELSFPVFDVQLFVED
jgi:hypothetical protein